jgi:hypothetical protein
MQTILNTNMCILVCYVRTCMAITSDEGGESASLNYYRE